VKRALTTAALGAAVLTVAACGGAGGSAGAGAGNTGGTTSTGGSTSSAGATQQYASGQTLTMILPADPGSLDPDLTSLSVTLQTDFFLYDSLVNIASNGSLQSGLATKWSGGTTSASFTLKPGVTCSDGTPLTASDVAANINFIGNPKNASSRIGIWVPPGATAKADSATGTVTVTSPVPDAFLVRDVGSAQIVCPNGMKDRGTLKEGAEGTGMYTLTSAVPGSQYTLTLRKGYDWGPGGFSSAAAGVPAKVVLKVVSNMTTAANLLLSGQANLAEIIGPDEQRLTAGKLYSQNVVSPLGELWFNEKPGLPGADPAVRTALTEALQLNQLGQVVTSGTGKPATGLVAPALSPCTGNTIGSNLPAYNLDAAKAALTAAGWKPGAGGIRAKDGAQLTMPVYYPTSLGSGITAGAELVQQTWGSLGVKVTLQGITDPELDTMIVGGQAAWGAGFIPLGLTAPDQLVPFVSGPTPPKGTNFAYITNSAYTADVTKAAATAGEAGCTYWNAAETALFKNVDLVPFVDSATPTFAKGATFQLSQGSVVPSSLRMLG
jgi:peptide/nickel transport system substrate-binding protein